ncbi:MAG: DUF4345 family protein [Chloroflexota bacterium]
MKIAARFLLGLLTLMFLYNGLLYMFTPEAQLSNTQIQPTGDTIFGMSNVRANIGAPMVTFGVLFALAVIRARKEPLFPIMIFLVLSIIARIAGLNSLGADPDFFSVRITVILTVMLAVTGFGFWVFQKEEA